MYMPHAHAYTYAYGIRIHAYAYARTHTHAILVCQPPDAWGDNPTGEKEKTRFYQFRLPEATDGCYADLTADTATDVPYGPWWDPQRLRPEHMHTCARAHMHMHMHMHMRMSMHLDV